MPDRPEFTALVIGAGPAGSAFALSCAKAGIRVALVESSRFPRNQPGETLHPGVEPLFASLGVLERILDAVFIVIAESGWNGTGRELSSLTAKTRGGPWLGFQADRANATHSCWTLREAGVEIFQPCRADGLIYDEAGMSPAVRRAMTERSANQRVTEEHSLATR